MDLFFLSSLDPLETKEEIVSVKILGASSGNFTNDASRARDRMTTVMDDSDDPVAFADDEWREQVVLDDETENEKLFQINHHRTMAPKHPQKCLLAVAAPTTREGGRRGRLLGESMIAKTAGANGKAWQEANLQKQECMFDVLDTHDPDIVF